MKIKKKSKRQAILGMMCDQIERISYAFGDKIWSVHDCQDLLDCLVLCQFGKTFYPSYIRDIAAIALNAESTYLHDSEDIEALSQLKKEVTSTCEKLGIKFRDLVRVKQ